MYFEYHIPGLAYRFRVMSAQKSDTRFARSTWRPPSPVWGGGGRDLLPSSPERWEVRRDA